MSFAITDAFVQQFQSNVTHVAQQGNSRLRGKVLEEPITGESAYMEQMGATSARKVTERHADSPVMNTQHLRRRVAPYIYDWGDLIDRQDKLMTLTDPESNYAKAGGMAMRRGQDDEIVAAFFSTAYAGHSGSTALTWPNGNSETSPSQADGTVVGVSDWTYDSGSGSGNAGLTISKLISAKVALDASEADEEEERYILVSSKQIGNLLATTQVTSADYNSVKALVDGKVDTFMGFKFIRSERIQKDSSGYARVPAWCKSAMGLGILQEIQTRVAENPGKRFSTQVYADESLGAARLEEAKLVEIKCVV